MPRNEFETGMSLEDEQQDRKELIQHGGPYIMLPPLSEGHRYELVTLSSGRQAVIVKEG